MHRLDGELDLAVQSLRKAIQIKPDYPDAHYKLGLTLEKLDLDKAIVSYKKCIELRPNFGLGECYLLMGQEAKGRELIRQSNGVIRFSNDSGLIILGSNINAAPPAT